jgi:proteasome lid subunit RPN8/RPN11
VASQGRSVVLNDALTQAMRDEAQAAYPNEACGLIVGVGKKAQFLACKNVAHEPTQTFRIDAKDYARAEDLGEVLAIWHSHPEGTTKPSDADLASCEAWQLPWLISAVGKRFDSFWHSEPRRVEPSGFQMPYLERPYVFGVFDCFSLAVDYYEREFGIKLDRFMEVRSNAWWQHERDFLGENYAAQGFVEVTDGSWEEGDLLFFAVNSPVPNHVAIYVTGDIILHHMINRLSRRETCGAYWHSHMTHHLRHTQRC